MFRMSLTFYFEEITKTEIVTSQNERLFWSGCETILRKWKEKYLLENEANNGEYKENVIKNITILKDYFQSRPK
jgi:hypothetical protein